MFSDTSYSSAILDRQGLLVAAPIDLRTKKVENFSPQLLQNFWYKLKQQEVTWQHYHLCLAVAEHQILGGKHHILGPETGKIWWLKKVQNLQKKYHCHWTFLRGIKPRWDFSQSCQHVYCQNQSQSRVSECQVRTILGDSVSKARVITVQAPQYRQHALTSDFLDPAKKKQHWPRTGSMIDPKG